MTKSLEEHVAELQEVIDGPHGKLWYHTPAVSALIAALEQSQQEKDKWVKWATELGEKSDVKDKRIAELEGYKTAYMEWSDKTDWVQKAPAGRFGFISLGMHLADVMTRHIEQLEASQLAVKLPKAVEICQFDHRRGLKGQDMYPRIDIVEMLRSAGITVYPRLLPLLIRL